MPDDELRRMLCLPTLTRYYWRGAEFASLLALGRVPSHLARNVAYRAMGMHLSRHAVVYGGAEIREPRKIYIGPGSVVGHPAILDGRNAIRMGADVNLSTGVWIPDRRTRSI